MEASPVNGSNGFRGGRGRGNQFRGSPGRGSPFRGSPFRGSSFRGSPLRGSPGGGRGGSPYQGSPNQGQGSPFRGRGSPFRGGRGSFRGANGQSPFRGGANGQSPFRGRGGGRGAFKGDNANARGGNATTSVNSKVQFVEPYIRKGLDSSFINFQCLFEITNLPTIFIQDINEIRTFIVETTGISVKKVFYRLPSDTYSSMTAVCETEVPQNVAQVANKLHGQVFRDRHLLVNTSFVNPGPLENCVKVFTQKPVATEVTEETLYSLFESCGNLVAIRLTNCKPDAALEALITFGDSDSVLNAVKLNAKLGKIKIHVASLGELFLNVSPVTAVDTVLKDFKTIHVEKQSNFAYVYFSDKESYSNALKLNGTAYDGVHKAVILEEQSVFIADPDFKLKPEQLKAVFGSSNIVAHPSRTDVHVIKFSSKTDVDNALKASPVLISNNLYNVYDSASKIPIAVKSEDSKVEDEEDQEEVDEEEEEEDEEAEDEGDEEDAEEEEVDAEEEEVDDEEEEVDDEEEEVDDEEEEVDDEEQEEEGEEEEGEEEEGEEEESSEEEVAPAPKAPSGKKGLQKQPPANIALKRKRDDSKIQKGGNKKQKA